MYVSSDVAAVPHGVTKAFLLTALSFNPHFLLTLTKRCEYTVHANYAQDYPIDPTTLITTSVKLCILSWHVFSLQCDDSFAI